MTVGEFGRPECFFPIVGLNSTAITFAFSYAFSIRQWLNAAD
jgi:hypothetical protein